MEAARLCAEARRLERISAMEAAVAAASSKSQPPEPLLHTGGGGDEGLAGRREELRAAIRKASTRAELERITALLNSGYLEGTKKSRTDAPAASPRSVSRSLEVAHAPKPKPAPKALKQKLAEEQAVGKLDLWPRRRGSVGLAMVKRSSNAVAARAKFGLRSLVRPVRAKAPGAAPSGRAKSAAQQPRSRTVRKKRTNPLIPVLTSDLKAWALRLEALDGTLEVIEARLAAVIGPSGPERGGVIGHARQILGGVIKSVAGHLPREAGHGGDKAVGGDGAREVKKESGKLRGHEGAGVARACFGFR